MDQLINQSQQKFHKVVELVKGDLATIRTGKASPQLIEAVVVDAYGSKMKLVELATIMVADPTTLVVTPFDITNLSVIEKAIGEANLGVSATQSDNQIRVIIPALSLERREEYVKLAKSKAEGGKVMARQIRHETLEELKSEQLDEDTQKRWEKDIQKWTDDTVEKLDILVLEKEKELLTL